MVEPRGWKNRSMYVGRFSQEKTYRFVELRWFPGVGVGGRIWLVVMVATYRGRRREYCKWVVGGE